MYDADGINILFIMGLSMFVILLLFSYIFHKLNSILEIEELTVEFPPELSGKDKTSLFEQKIADKQKELMGNFPSHKVQILDTEFLSTTVDGHLHRFHEVVLLKNAKSARIVFVVTKY
jgi:hypothetical protein